jgi:hypothetical protein
VYVIQALPVTGRKGGIMREVPQVANFLVMRLNVLNMQPENPD